MMMTEETLKRLTALADLVRDGKPVLPGLRTGMDICSGSPTCPGFHLVTDLGKVQAALRKAGWRYIIATENWGDEVWLWEATEFVYLHRKVMQDPQVDSTERLFGLDALALAMERAFMGKEEESRVREVARRGDGGMSKSRCPKCGGTSFAGPGASDNSGPGVWAAYLFCVTCGELVVKGGDSQARDDG